MRSGLLRLILTILVVVQHYSRLSLALGAICLLFVVSGFWLSKSWSERYALSEQPYRTFIISRLWRILPIFWLCNIIGVLVVGTTSTSLVELIPNVIVIGHGYLQHPALLPAWPLDILLQFSFLVPLLCFLLIWMPAVSGSLLTATGIVGLAMLVLWGGSGDVGVQHLNLLHFLVFFLIGMLAYFRPGWLIVFAAMAAMLAAVWLIFWLPDIRLAVLRPAQGGSAFLFHNHLVNIILAFLALPVVLHGLWRHYSALSPPANSSRLELMGSFIGIESLKRFRLIRSCSSFHDKAVGDLSYIIYLLHWPICVFTNDHFASLTPAARLPIVAAAIGFTFLASLGVLRLSRLVERPREAFVARRLATGAASAGLRRDRQILATETQIGRHL